MKAFFTFLHAVLIAILAVILLFLCLVLAGFIAFMNPYMAVVAFSFAIGALILWTWRRYRNPPTNTVFDKAMNHTIKPKPKGSITGLTDGAKIFMIVGYFFIFVPISIFVVVMWVLEEIRNKNNV
jgi:hypothetical protein